MKVSKDFKEFIELLNKNNVNYLLVGGYAVGYHSRPRYTEDIDIWIQPSLENAKKIIHVLNKFGFTGVSVSIEELIQPEKIIQLGLPPQRIDILTSIDGVNFNDAWERRIVDSFGDIPVFIISLKDLIKNKSSSGRTKDLQDIEWIKMYGKEA